MSTRHALTGPAHRIAVPLVIWASAELAARLFSLGNKLWQAADDNLVDLGGDE